MYSSETTSEERVVLLQSLGYQILGEINSVSVIMPTALVGTVLLTLRGRGVGMDEVMTSSLMIPGSKS